MSERHLHGVAPLDRSVRGEAKDRNVCHNCKVRWMGRGVLDACPKCGASFTERDAWKAQPFVPQRLASASEGRGLSVTELADRVGGLPIAQFESPTAPRKPTTVEILQLAHALRFPPAWFVKPWDPKYDVDGGLFLCNTSTYCDDEECGELAIAECDFPLAGGGTCDRKMCARHGKRVGRDRDYCLVCVATLHGPQEART